MCPTMHHAHAREYVLIVFRHLFMCNISDLQRFQGVRVAALPNTATRSRREFTGVTTEANLTIIEIIFVIM